MKQLLWAAVALSAACSSAIRVQEPIDPQEYAKCPLVGRFSLRGVTFAKKENGEIVSGAGREVHLDLFTKYSRAVFEAIFERQKDGATFRTQREDETVSLNEVMRACRRTVTADADGKFVFRDTLPGVYVASAYLSWKDPSGHWVGRWNFSLVGMHGMNRRRPLELSDMPDFVPRAPSRMTIPPAQENEEEP